MHIYYIPSLNKYKRLAPNFQNSKHFETQVNSQNPNRAWIECSLPGGSSIGPGDDGVEDWRRGSGAWLQQIGRSGHDLRESASASVGVVLGDGCYVWWLDEASSMNFACVFDCLTVCVSFVWIWVWVWVVWLLPVGSGMRATEAVNGCGRVRCRSAVDWLLVLECWFVCVLSVNGGRLGFVLCEGPEGLWIVTLCVWCLWSRVHWCVTIIFVVFYLVHDSIYV